MSPRRMDLWACDIVAGQVALVHLIPEHPDLDDETAWPTTVVAACGQVFSEFEVGERGFWTCPAGDPPILEQALHCYRG